MKKYEYKFVEIPRIGGLKMKGESGLLEIVDNETGEVF